MHRMIKVLVSIHYSESVSLSSFLHEIKLL